MKSFLIQLWKDDCGAIIVTEWVMFVSIIVMGVISGAIKVRNVVNSQFNSIVDSFPNIEYKIPATNNTVSNTGESEYRKQQPVD